MAKWSLPLWRSVANGDRRVQELEFRHAAAGGQDRIQCRRRQYYRRTHGPVYTVGSDDPDRIEETNEELIKMLNEDEMCDALVMVFCQEAGVAWCDDGG